MKKTDHINNFKKALLNITPEYFGIPTIQNQIHLNEKAFAFELYHQLRLIYTGCNWYVNGELRKGLTFFPSYRLNNTLIPDLVIHHHNTTNNNMMAVEIKSNPKITGSKLIKDLEKLDMYTQTGTGYLNYHIGILLVTNCDFRKKLSNMRLTNKNRIKELLNSDKISIWNINTPIFQNEFERGTGLKEECLEIITKDNI